MGWRSSGRELVTFQPSPPRLAAAVSAAIAMTLPVVGFTVVGLPSLGTIAAAGSLVALYLGDRSRRERARALPPIGAGLVLAATLGAATASSGPLALLVLVLAVIAGSAVLLARRAGPPGGLFFALVTGTGIRLGTPVADGGAGFAPLEVAALVAIGAAIGWLVVIAPLVVPAVRRRDALLASSLAPRGFSLSPVARQLLLRVALSAVLAALAGAAIGDERAYWIVLTSVAILQAQPHLRLSALRGVHRVLGTVVGVLLFAGIAWLHPQGYLLALVLAVLQFGIEMVIVRHYGLALTMITPLSLLLAEQGAHVDLVGIALDRVRDTLIGAAIAFAVLLGSLALRRMRTRPGR